MAIGRILVVEDDPDIASLLSAVLTKYSFEVRHIAEGGKTFETVELFKPDLLILDLTLPDVDGLDICRVCRTTPSLRSIPILVLSSRDGDNDIIAALELGADDYVVKGASPSVLLARVRSILRRKEVPAAEGRLSAGPFTLDVGTGQLLVDGVELKVTYSERKLLEALLLQPGECLSRPDIIHFIHGPNYHVNDKSVDVLVTGLRKKLGLHGAEIEAVRQRGYRVKV